MTVRQLMFAAILSFASTCPAAEFFVAPDGKPDAAGTQESPWDITSTLAGQQPVKPGDTVWLRGGTYRCEEAYKTNGQGYKVTLNGTADKPVIIRAARSERAAIDGGMLVQDDHLWLWDLEIAQPDDLPRVTDEGGSHPDLGNPSGGITIHGDGCRCINLVIQNVIASAACCCLIVNVPLTRSADAPRPLLVEARIKDGSKREFETRIVDHLDQFDRSRRVPLDDYGGWKTERYEATGFFYPKKIDDRWWLIDPEGYQFIHVAVNSVSPGKSPTNRETLPKRFGSRENWRDQTMALLRNNGFNGTGNWSDNDLIRSGNPKLVYTTRLNFMGSYGRKTGRVVQEPGHLGYPNKCIFVFDPQFQEHAEQVAREAAVWKDDPYLLGYFSDNELPFPSDLLDRYLQLEQGDPGRDAAHRWLEQQGAQRPQIDEDLREAFRGYVVDRYLGICKRAIRKYDPNHLFLGPRFYGSEKRSEAVFRAAGKHLDVVAVNLYGQWSPSLEMLREWEEWSGRPVIVTEWYAKGDDSGMENLSGAGWTVATQQERGWFYQNFTLGLLESKVCVGWHWFKYMDNDPRDLRTDPSNRNWNKGIVTAAYEPWQPLLDAMRQLNDSVYPLVAWFDEPKPVSPVGEGYRLAWHDEFNGDKLDMTRWAHRMDTRFWSTQVSRNVSVGDGCLRLLLKKEKDGTSEYTAGGVISRQTFQYGYYEARFRCPPGAGWHTSFWMMRHNWRKTAADDEAVQEIDVCEQDSINRRSYGVNLHRWKPQPHASHGHKRIVTPDLAADFHVWGCEFTPRIINYYFNGKLVHSLDATIIPHGPQNIWLTSIAAPLGGTKAVDESQLPAIAEFDYVRYFAN